MKFIPLGYRPNVSATKHGSSNISMQVDSRGLPHISWLESKNGHNEVHYSFWDGQQWTYHQHPVIGWTEEELVSSGSSLILSAYEQPYVAFSRSLPTSRSAITIASKQEDGWLLDELGVDYNAKTVGLFKYDYSILFSSTSSSSLGYTSSSSSGSSNSSSSSKDTSNSSTSSSSSKTSESISTSLSSSSGSSNSSSSSIDSSSSSSADDARIFVATYDAESVFRIYAIRPSGWYLIGEKSMSITDISTLKYVVCGKHLGITWHEPDQLYYNFFNINESSWKYGLTQNINVDGLSSVDVEGFSSEDDGKLLFAMIVEKTDETQVYNMTVDTNGVTSYLGDDYLIESEPVLVTGSNDYVSSGYSDISVCRDIVTDTFAIVAFGGRLAKYVLNGSWVKEYGSVEGISSGMSPDVLTLKSYNGIVSMAFSSIGGDVYYFVEDSSQSAFVTVYPYITVFNEQRLYLTQYKDGNLTDGVKILCTWWDRIGDILRESKTRVNVIVNDGEDPWCFTSSSSSSSTTSESSSSTSSSSSSSNSSSSSSTSSSSSSHTSSSSNDTSNTDSSMSSSSYCGIWAHWKLNENSAVTSIVVDSTGNNRHGLLKDWGASITTSILSVPGKINRAFQWDWISPHWPTGAPTYNWDNQPVVRVVDQYLPLNDITIAAWIYMTSWGGPEDDAGEEGKGHGRIVDDTYRSGASTRGGNYEFYVESDWSNNNYYPNLPLPPTGRLKFCCDAYNGVTSVKSRPSVYNLTLNRWHFVAVTKSSAALPQVKFYVDGVLQPCTADTCGNAVIPTPPGGAYDSVPAIHIGARRFEDGNGYDRPFHGIIDNVMVDDRVWSAAEILCLYNNRIGTEEIDCVCGGIPPGPTPPATLCNLDLDTTGGNAGYFNEWDVSAATISDGFYVEIDEFETYMVKDALKIYADGVTMYNSGCIRTDYSPITGVSVWIPMGTQKVGVRVVPNCEGTTSTAWILKLSCHN